MASGVEELLDMLFDMIDDAKNAPLSSDKCVIERDRALDLIDDVRSQFPIELTEAKKIMANRAEVIAAAKREAESIHKAAEEKARRLLAEDTITTQAKQRANEMLQKAEERSREGLQAAEERSRDMLQKAETRSREMLQQAEERSRDLKRSANEYCEDALRRTEEAVAEAYNEIKQSHARFRAAAGVASASATSANGRPIYDAAADED